MVHLNDSLTSTNRLNGISFLVNSLIDRNNPVVSLFNCNEALGTTRLVGLIVLLTKAMYGTTVAFDRTATLPSHSSVLLKPHLHYN